jgi:hypothetical protein
MGAIIHGFNLAFGTFAGDCNSAEVPIAASDRDGSGELCRLGVSPLSCRDRRGTFVRSKYRFMNISHDMFRPVDCYVCVALLTVTS